MKRQLSATFSMDYDDAGHGKPVVLLHAFPLARAMWRPQVEALQAEYRVITPDLRGFGDSGGFTDAPSIRQMADDVAGLLDALGVTEPVVLGGLSMGGYVALTFARDHAARLLGLILADTRAEPDNAEGKANRDNLIAFAQRHTAADVIEQMLPKMLSDETRSRRPEVVAEVKRLAAAQSVDGVVTGLQALRDRPDSSPVLGGIRVPTLVVVGADDALTPRAMAETLVAGIRGARLEIIPGAGHLSNLEQPAAFNEAVRAFLAAC
jgi:3-oxoadipate enol-lactonase